MGRVLALDYGERRIGLAVTDAEQRVALAYGVVAAQPQKEALAGIQRVIAAENVESIVVGLPLTLEGHEGPQASKVREFVTTLQKATNLPVQCIDERFTTHGGEEEARMKGVKTADAEAARLILRAWLDKNAGSG